MSWDSLPYSGGDRIGATLDAAERIVSAWGTSQLMRKMAAEIIKQHHARTDHEEARAIQIWTHNRVKYRRDPADAEMIQDPVTTIKNGGDCDDQAILAAALLRAIGHNATVATVQWKNRANPSHAVALDFTAGAVIDPVSEVWPEQWPPPGYEVGRITYKNKNGQPVSLDGLFSNIHKAFSKVFVKVFKPNTLLGKLADPLGLSSRNIKFAGRLADVAGTAAVTFFTLGAGSALMAGGSVGGFGATMLAGAKIAGSAALAAGKFSLSALGKAAGGALVAAALSKTSSGEQMSPAEQAALQQYQSNPSYYDSGAAYSGGSGGGGGGGFFDGATTPGTPGASAALPVLPIAIGLGALFLITRK